MHRQMLTHTFVLKERPPSLYEWQQGVYLCNRMRSLLCKYGVLNDRVRLLLLIPLFKSVLKTWYFSTWSPRLLPSSPPSAAFVAIHSKLHRLKLSSEHCSLNWHKCKHKIWQHTHVHTGCWQMSFYFWLCILSLCTSTPARTHTHIYQEYMYSHPDTHTHTYIFTATFSMLSRQRVRGHWLLSACQREEGKREEEEQPWFWRNLQNGAPHHSIKTNAIRAGPYLSRLMLADRVAAIWNAHAIMHFLVPLTDWWCIISRLDGSCRNR